MQKLLIQTKAPDGRDALTPVHVVRSWHTASGVELYLHSSGVYGYRDGSPVESEEKLRDTVDHGHLAAALAWWASTGKALAARHYTNTATPAPISPKPVLYWRYPAGKRPRNLPAPLGHLEAGFPVKPDWWGAADSITLSGDTYEIVPDGTEPIAPAAPPEVSGPEGF